MSLFVHSDDHAQRMFGRRCDDSAIVEPNDARARLRTLPFLRSSTDSELDAVMEALESWDIAFKLTDVEKLLYGRPDGGYLFPSMRRSAELLSLPILPRDDDVASETWIADQVRACLSFFVNLLTYLVFYSSCCGACCQCRGHSFACKCGHATCTTHRISCSATARCFVLRRYTHGL